MAKKLVYNYTFDASAGKVFISGRYTLRTLILITNVTDQQIIYNFADANAGATVQYSSSLDRTTIHLEYDTSSMDDTDELQILADLGGDTEVEPGESIIDPVHKFRVSNPENLIDTDFEYGLQSTKWETIELVSNIPSVYTRDSGVSIGGIVSVTATAAPGNTITVTCSLDHDLALGDPIEVQGLSNRLANGKWLVTSVPTNKTFIYKISQNISTSQNLATAYTTIIPGSFFSGSELNYNLNEGIVTDNAANSDLTFTTNYRSNVPANTSVYITNTVGKNVFNISDVSATAPDGSAIVAIASTEESIYLAGNNLYDGQEIFIKPGSGGALPTLEVGASEPSGTRTTKLVFEGVEAGMDTNVAAMTFHEYMLNSYSFGQSYAFYSDGNYLTMSGSVTKQGSFIRQYLRYGDWLNNPITVDLKNGTTNIFNSANTIAQFSTPGNRTTSIYTGEPYDKGATYSLNSGSLDTGLTSLSGYITECNTAFQNNSFKDYYVKVVELADPRSLGTGVFSWAFNHGVADSKRMYTSRYARYDTQQSSNTLTNAGSGWYYHYTAIQYKGRWTTTYPGYIGLCIFLANQGNDGYRGTPGNWALTSSAGYLSFSSSNFNTTGTGYRIETLVSYYPSSYSNNSYYGPSGSELTDAQMVSNIVNEVKPRLAYATWANGTGSQNTVYAVPQTGDRVRLEDDQGREYVFSNVGTSPIVVETGQVSGVFDNYYDIESKTNDTTSTTFTISAGSQIAPRTLEFTNSDFYQDPDTSEYYIQYDVADGHGIQDGQKVTFNVDSGTAPGGLTNDTEYYAIVDDNKHFRLGISTTDALQDNSAITNTGSGSFNVEVFSINGRSPASGTVNTTESSTTVTGNNTKFLSSYKIGDKFSIVSDGSDPLGYGITLRSFVESEVVAIVDDTQLVLNSPIGFTTAEQPHYIDTKINVRADGTFIHRPFDGGVEITAGQSPNSSIVRQTRKYFRYQSGKGIQCSMAINFNPARPVRSASGSGTAVTITTEYPHGLSTSDSVKISGSEDTAYNGTYTITKISDVQFSYTAGGSVTDAVPSGFLEYSIQSYSNAGIRAGLFDYQNGFFFEFDGSTLYAVRRSSVQQISGTCEVTNKSNVIRGTNTVWSKQLSDGDYIVLRGQSHVVSRVVSDTEVHIEPAYRGISALGVIATKTIDTKVAQSNWNIDKADGTGPSAFELDMNKIQMVYMDYSWYGAGKIRFGFKDTNGHVRYMHQFVHNNRLNEAYMRSGNVPARYEAFNTSTPTYVPSLFHWGTSVIMDGGFDDDDSYLFSASGKTLTFTNGDADTATTTGASSLVSFGRRFKDYYVKIPFATSDAAKFSSGIPLYTSDDELDGDAVDFTAYGSSTLDVYIYISSGYSAPAIYPIISSGVTVNIGAESAGGGAVDLNSDIPLISIRLAPSADNNLIGQLGARDIINRMQLKLQELGVSVTHDAEIKVILNGSLSNLTYENVGTPSLSQFIAHASGDKINGGITIYKFRANGGATDITGKRLSVSNAFDLSQLVDLGNSILGGDGVFPNGPDIITITASVINTAEIDSASSFQVASRLSWAESQA